MMHHQIDKKKIFIYIFFFLILSTINNISINNSHFIKISKIEVSGLNNKSNLEILNKIKVLKLENIFFLEKKKINEIILKNDLVENFFVKKKYPSSLDVKINKTNFLANLQIEENNFFVGSNGRLIETKFTIDSLPHLSMNTPTNEFLYFTDIIKNSIFDYGQISNIIFFPSKRWDIKTKNNILIKLPNKNVDEALKNAHYIINDKKFLNIKLIDLRMKNKIITNE
jgi:cell division protein FtsQ